MPYTCCLWFTLYPVTKQGHDDHWWQHNKHDLLIRDGMFHVTQAVDSLASCSLIIDNKEKHSFYHYNDVLVFNVHTCLFMLNMLLRLPYFFSVQANIKLV